LVGELLECRVGHPEARLEGAREHDAQEPQVFRLRHGQRTQQHGVHDAEDGGVGRDAEREHEKGDDREAAAAAEAAQRIDDVLPYGVQHVSQSVT